MLKEYNHLKRDLFVLFLLVLPGLLFLQETHSNIKVEQNWKEDFKGHVCFSLTEKQILIVS